MSPESELTEAREEIAALRKQLEDARRAAERLAAIVEWSDDAMFSMSPDALIQTWNPGAERLLGYCRDEIIGRPAGLLVSPAQAGHLARFLELTATGELTPTHDVRCVRKDGSAVDVTFSCSVIRGDEGAMTGFSVVIRDITARLAAETELAVARADRAVLEDRDRMARDLHDRVIQRIFAAGMALQTAGRLSRSPEAQTRIEAVVSDLDTTIDELRETIFALRRSSQPAAGLRYSLLSVTQELAPLLGFNPEVTLQGPVDKVPEGTAAQVLAVCREALTNVARHAGATMATVTLSVGEDVLLHVRDNGRGTGETGGIGGLANMRERAELRGGTFSVDSALGAGTSLRWRVPL